MRKVVSISGGKTSAYIAANYQADRLVFSLVRTDDKTCRFPDRKLAAKVEERINAPFVGTLEDDLIIYTMFDLEQFLGRQIDWVTGITFDEVVKTKGGWLPNKLHRYCTTHMKLEPIFYWWAETFGEPVEMMIGFRANEGRRVNSVLSSVNEQGLSEFKATFEKHEGGRHDGLNKWEMVAWRRPTFPLFDDGIFKDDIENFWEDKPVRFAPLNNCVGCFHRNPMLLRKMYDFHPEKLQWFADQEGDKKAFWRSDISYNKIINHPLQLELSLADFSECDSGFCGV